MSETKTVNHHTKRKKKQQQKRIIITILSVVTVSAFIFGIYNWFKPTDFNQDVPLTTTVSRVDVLKWVATGNFEGPNLNTPTGDWELNLETGEYTNPEYPNCTTSWVRLGGDTGIFGNDLDDTNRYLPEFTDGAETTNSPTGWASIHNHTGKFELIAPVLQSGGAWTQLYFRQLPLTGVGLIGKVVCSTEQELTSLTQVNGKLRLTDDYGITVGKQE